MHETPSVVYHIARWLRGWSYVTKDGKLDRRASGAVAVRTINIRRAHARYRNVNPFKRDESLKLLGYGNKQSRFASDCYTERVPSLRKTTKKRRDGREEKSGEA